MTAMSPRCKQAVLLGLGLVAVAMGLVACLALALTDGTIPSKYWNPTTKYEYSDARYYLQLPQPPYIRSGGTCGICLRRRCSNHSSCANTWGYDDPEGEQRHLCMCACCGIQCLIGYNALYPQVGFSPSTYPGCNVTFNFTGSYDVIIY